jgi:hypothetical protein
MGAEWVGDTLMIRYECDFCHRLREPGEAWLLGFAAENVGVTAVRREITIVPTWSEARAVDYLAVHFCCDQCRRRYMARLFGEEPPEEIVEDIAVVPAKRVLRVFPGAGVDTRVTPTKRKSAKSKSRRKTA